MAHLEMTHMEIEMLREVLVGYLSELRMEIAFSDRKEFRDFLKARRDFLEDFVRRLEKELAGAGRELMNIDRLRNVDILHGLTDWELNSIAQFFHEESVNEGIILCQEGARADRLYVLVEGSVAITSREGEEQEINTPGKILGWSFLVPPNRYTASVTATSPSRFLVIKSPDFYYLIHKEPKMGIKIMDNLAQVVAERLKAPRTKVEDA